MIDSIEALNYNIFGVQNHPEKTVYDTMNNDSAASTISSLSISNKIK